MRLKFAIALLAMAGAPPLLAQSAQNGPSAGSPLIAFDEFLKLGGEVAPYRQARLLSLSDFKARQKADNVLLLDARSASAFQQGHIKGAVNLPLPDFTADALAALIGEDKDREILIYCNNNFVNNIAPVVTKARPLALNIGTFINLYGYGYRNIYELGDAIDMNDPALNWVSAVKG